MADLASLMKVAPISGGMMIGQSHDSELATADMERQRLAALVQELQTKQQFDQQANPLRIQEMGLKNRGLEAGLPGIVADASLKGSQAAKAAGTLQTDIDAGNALNEGKIAEEKSKLVNRLTNDLINFSNVVDQVPAPLRAGTLKQIMTDAGYKMNSPMAQQLFQQFTADPDNMSKNMLALSEKIGRAAAQRSPAYHQRLDEQDLQGRQKLDEIKAQGVENRRLEAIRVEGRKQAAAAKANQESNSIWDQVRSGKLKLNEMPAAFTAAARKAASEEERDAMLLEAQKAADLIRLKAETPKPGTVDAAGTSGLPEAKRAPNPYAKDGGPKPGTKENPIKLD